MQRTTNFRLAGSSIVGTASTLRKQVDTVSQPHVRAGDRLLMRSISKLEGPRKQSSMYCSTDRSACRMRTIAAPVHPGPVLRSRGGRLSALAAAHEVAWVSGSWLD